MHISSIVIGLFSLFCAAPAAKTTYANTRKTDKKYKSMLLFLSRLLFDRRKSILRNWKKQRYNWLDIFCRRLLCTENRLNIDSLCTIIEQIFVLPQLATCRFLLIFLHEDPAFEYRNITRCMQFFEWSAVAAIEYTPRSVFTALHEIQTRSSDENSVWSSVCLSNARFVTKRKKVVPAFLYHIKDHLP